MHWLEEVKRRLKNRNQLLFRKDSDFLQDLALALASRSHRTLILWALGLAAGTVAELEARHPGERRPAEALSAARAWAAGELKMRPAQRSILRCHALAKELPSPADIAACHAVAQAYSVVHTSGHALGYPIYDLTSLVRRLGVPACAAAVEARKQAYFEMLLYWEEQLPSYRGSWAAFLPE